MLFRRIQKLYLEKIKKEVERVIESITMKNRKILYFEDIDEPPYKIIKKHYSYIIKEFRNIDKAKELEDKIIKMINEVYQRVEEKGDYIKAFESFMNEGLARLKRTLISGLDIISNALNIVSIFSIPLSLGVVKIGYNNEYNPNLSSNINIIGAMLTLTSVLARSKLIETIALKCVARNKIFELKIKEKKFGVEIKKEEIPADMRIKTPKPYEEFRYRIFRIPVKEGHHISEEVTLAKLKK